MKKSAMKAMKRRSMKKSMKKSMRKRRAMRVSIKGKKASVFKGRKVKTSGGLKKSDLMKNKRGKVVSKKMHARGLKQFKKVAKWAAAVKAARKSLGVRGFLAVGGKTAKGQALLKKVRSLYRK